MLSYTRLVSEFRRRQLNESFCACAKPIGNVLIHDTHDRDACSVEKGDEIGVFFATFTLLIRYEDAWVFFQQPAKQPDKDKQATNQPTNQPDQQPDRQTDQQQTNQPGGQTNSQPIRKKDISESFILFSSC